MNLTLTAVRRSLVAASFAASFAAMSAGTASAQVVDINGGSSWSGWSSISNSQTAGVWVRGQTDRTFNIFRTQFTLNASQSVGGSRLADGSVGDGVGYSGDDASSLFTGAWQAGDRIIGVGIQYTGSTRGTTAYLHVDAHGDNIFGASSVGAGDGGCVVFGPGEQVSLDFASPTQAVPPGATRRYILETRGWCKDMDLFTRDGETIAPLPAPETEQAQKSRTRPMGGR
jgi:hypothetical protein